MDEKRFNALTCALDVVLRRRTTLVGMLGAMLMTGTYRPGNGDTEARRKKKRKRKEKQEQSQECAATCAGCCDGSGACQAGTETAACGAGGATCTACLGDAVCSGGACADPPCGGSVPCRVFVTSTTHNGNLGGLTGADAICQARATAAGLPGTYMAWLSDNPTTPPSRFVHSTAPYRRVDGVTIANNFTDLTDGTLAAAISVTDIGAAVSDPIEVWTSTRFDGTPAQGGGSCDHWTDDTAIFTAVIGNATASNATWSAESSGTTFCFELRRLYCFQQS